jgi:hypothetical protein
VILPDGCITEARTFTDSPGLLPDIRIRFARYYDELLVDEVQDFAGHDFNFLLELCRAEITVLCCGDFYQHTFDTAMTATLIQRCTTTSPRYEASFDAAGFAVDRDAQPDMALLSFSSEFIKATEHPYRRPWDTCLLIETIADTERSATLHADNTVTSSSIMNITVTAAIP